MSNLFQPATRHQRKLRMALVGPSGSGKTFTALTIATALGGRIAVIDTERGSASAYADRFQFDTLQLTSFAPERYLEGIQAASDAGYGVLIIDSLSHAWAGKDGILEFVDKVAARTRSNNSFGAWREATPVHNKLVDGILDANCHVIVTMRSKQEYVQERDERTGKTTVRKVGMQPVQRDGLEYEMDIVADLDWENTLVVSKTRCEALQGHVERKAGAEFANTIQQWVGAGAPAPERPITQQPHDPEPTNGARYLSTEKADSLTQKLTALGVKDPIAFAAGIVGRKVQALTELGTGEAKHVYEVASTRTQQTIESISDSDGMSFEELEAQSSFHDETAQPGLDLEPITSAQLKALHTVGTKLGFGSRDRERFLAFLGELVGREIASSKDLTKSEAAKLLDLGEDGLAERLDALRVEQQEGVLA